MLYSESSGTRILLDEAVWLDSDMAMRIEPKFLTSSERAELVFCVRRHREDHGVARRANAITGAASPLPKLDRFNQVQRWDVTG